MSGTISLAILVGLLGPSIDIQVYVLFVLWAALVGMMIPRLLEARASSSALDAARRSAARQRVVNHDMASALLTIEGGITALRYLYHEGQNHRTDETNDDVVAARVESIAHAIETEIRRIRRISSSESPVNDACDVAATVEPLVALHRASGAHVECELDTPERVAMSADDLARVVANLLDNCARHAAAASVRVTGSIVGHSYQLRVSDNGPGIACDVVDRAFDHGVSSRAGGGLGLYSVRSIVETCGGSVTIELSSGTTVQLQLPIASDEPANVRQPARVRASRRWELAS